MKKAAHSIVLLLIALHLGFFAVELFFYVSWADFRKNLGFEGIAPGEAVIIVKNQAFSNLFLAIGLAVGLFMDLSGRREGELIETLILLFIAAAGVVGWQTVGPPLRGMLAFLAGQTGLSLAALVLFRLSAARQPQAEAST